MRAGAFIRINTVCQCWGKKHCCRMVDLHAAGSVVGVWHKNMLLYY